MPNLKKLGFISSYAVYLLAALLMLLLTKFLIPFLSKITGQEIVLFWFIVAGLGVFLPMLITTYFFLKYEGYPISKITWVERLRFKKPTRNDMIWCIGGLIAVGILSALLMKVLGYLVGEFDHSPSFMSFEPLTKGRYWLLLVWFPYWILNIMGEEIFWRGIMFPRQEIVFKKYTWLVHGTGWGLFHIAFGWQLLLTLIPLLYIQSYIVQKTKNSWTGVIMHAAINGPSFIAISFGLV